jgi:hypothetical protein
MITSSTIVFKIFEGKRLLSKRLNDQSEWPHVWKLQRKSALKFCVYHIIANLTLTISAIGRLG